MYIDGMLRYADHAQLVGLCDVSRRRLEFWQNHVAENGGGEVATFPADAFDQMISQCKPDVVIVTTVDCWHHKYIIAAMERGCDVVTEKPMTIDAQKAQAIIDTVKETGRKVRVTFNYRYMPAFSKLCEIVRSGEIGTPRLIDFQWRLDTRHGADYFRRWHREKEQSGGLLVHKSTHHFDLVNFIINDQPQTVFAFGDLCFYGQANAEQRGERYDYDRYTGHVTPEEDSFALVLTDHWRAKQLYYEAESDNGYVRDRNVFGGESRWPITAEDTMTVMARYRQGAMLSYSLVAYSPWEGERLTITGTRGQVEYFGRGQGHVISGQSSEELAAEQYTGERYIRLQSMFQPPRMVEIPTATGGHGGSDDMILQRVFDPDAPADPLERDADHIDGAASILTGVAANQAIATGQPIDVPSLVRF
jgi:predicted dehydrogenase